ncbi:hypothetical protein B597_006030 [Stutzerimonas stutzeri KOS6]|uniref:DUF1090 domain-containing protein n=2 Tax=Stutzerimonas stutzeri TaxID=316 RepID=A0A061JUU1_STUST|nr:hypothetical protein B597_006030 [Stutzerimonas stutzeri KOS6]
MVDICWLKQTEKIVPSRFTHAALMAACLLASALCSAVQTTDHHCEGQRTRYGHELQEARLSGDKVRMQSLEETLQRLAAICRGEVPPAKRPAFEQASQEVNEREAQLREALSQGDPLLTERRQRALAEARRRLEATRR